MKLNPISLPNRQLSLAELKRYFAQVTGETPVRSKMKGVLSDRELAQCMSQFDPDPVVEVTYEVTFDGRKLEDWLRLCKALDSLTARKHGTQKRIEMTG